jgi:hypothetical protein
MTRLGCAVLLLMAGCAQPQPATVNTRGDNSPDKLARDRDLCRAQVAEMMRTRRAIDDSRRDVFRGQQDRYGVGALPAEMADIKDQNSTDRLMSDCMEARGWPQPKPEWWQRMGTIRL